MLKKLKQFLSSHLYVQNFLESVLLTFVVEVLSRRSLVKAVRFMLVSPVTFLCNFLIIFLTFCAAMLVVSRRRFAKTLVIFIWLILGIVNCIVLKYRMTPFSAEDFAMIPSLFAIAKNYLTVRSAVLIVAALVVVLAGIVTAWIRIPSEHFLKKNLLGAAWRLGAAGIGLYCFLQMGMQTEAISTDFENLADAYEEYGFAYCFSTSVIDVGISEPDNYSSETVQAIADRIENGREKDQTTSADTITPNIIMIQLESFFDPTYIQGCTYSDDPIPFIRSLKESCTSGFLNVPVVGAGTSNTEFEILTGMTTDCFGAGEYPYNTVMKTTTTESVPNILRQNGYTSTVIHNNTGTFYNRDTVFSMMGFDRFIPLEYMYDTEKTPNNWTKDNVLPDVIMDTLSMSDGEDFIYTITVQSHGRYPEEEVLENPQITVNCSNENISSNALTYYVNEVHEVDEMVENLVDKLSSMDEPVVLVLYGDHLPALDFSEEDLTQPDLYETEYVIWNNFGMEMEDHDEKAETISAHLLDQFGLAEGIIPQFHLTCDDTASADEDLEMLEYDMLYGKGYIYRELAGILSPDLEDEEGTSEVEEESEASDECFRPYAASDLQFGYREITVSGASVNADGILTVTGDNFNDSSRIVVDGKVQKTVYIDGKTLQTDGDVPEDSQTVTVGQFDANGDQLGTETDPVEISFS